MRNTFPVFDLHCDTAVALSDTNQVWAENNLHIDLNKESKLFSHTQVYSFCCVYDEHGDALTWPEAEAKFIRCISNFYSELAKHSDTHKLCRTADDLLEAAKEGKHGVFLSLEGPEVIGCDPGRLDELKDLGIVMTTLTWNHANLLAGSHKTGEGLTAQGKAFVRRAQELGIIIDVSHLSEQAFWDICDISMSPIVASHSNSRAICDHSRNLTDRQFKTICNFDGLVGLNLYRPFLTTAVTATYDDVRRHAEHFIGLGGKHHLSLGFDLDGCDELPEGFRDLSDCNGLGKALIEGGLDEQMVLNLMNNNAARFFLQYLQRRNVGEFLQMDELTRQLNEINVNT